MSAESLHITGDMANKIKNNVKEQTNQFSWKLTFPVKEIDVSNIPTEGIMILNKNLKRMRSEFVIYVDENAILISPQTPYRPGQEYFFWAKYSKQEICVAFTVTADKKMQTFDQKTSLEKLTTYSKFESTKIKRAARAAETKVATPRKPTKKAPDIID